MYRKHPGFLFSPSRSSNLEFPGNHPCQFTRSEASSQAASTGQSKSMPVIPPVHLPSDDTHEVLATSAPAKCQRIPTIQRTSNWSTRRTSTVNLHDSNKFKTTTKQLTLHSNSVISKFPNYHRMLQRKSGPTFRVENGRQPSEKFVEQPVILRKNIRFQQRFFSHINNKISWARGEEN